MVIFQLKCPTILFLTKYFTVSKELFRTLLKSITCRWKSYKLWSNSHWLKPCLCLTLFRTEMGGLKGTLPVFSLYITSTNVGISPDQTLLLTILLQWCKISRPYLVPVPSYWTWTKTSPEKLFFFFFGFVFGLWPPIFIV